MLGYARYAVLFIFILAAVLTPGPDVASQLLMAGPLLVLYGVSIGRVFFGESMFSRARDASKVALVHLTARLIHGGFKLLDTQFVTSHLQQFGARSIPRVEYMERLTEAMSADADYYKLDPDTPGERALQLITQTS